MIPPWEAVLDHATCCLAPGGSLHVVDFGDQSALPAPFRAVLNQWLAWFHVTPRTALQPTLAGLAARQNMRLRYTSRFRGYAAHAVVERPGI
jgi:S-adenosylmethionine-diacylgycerolhomoserine-N-methlytransferase